MQFCGHNSSSLRRTAAWLVIIFISLDKNPPVSCVHLTSLRIFLRPTTPVSRVRDWHWQSLLGPRPIQIHFQICHPLLRTPHPPSSPEMLGLQFTKLHREALQKRSTRKSAYAQLQHECYTDCPWRRRRHSCQPSVQGLGGRGSTRSKKTQRSHF